MNIRVKFTKEGPMKFIGHLDMMRYFQKAIRRAGIDIAFSGGFSPHMILSFAAPLGVGITSSGEYFDMEVNTTLSSSEALSRMNQAMAEGIRIVSYRRIPEGKAAKAMSLVAAADYAVSFRPGQEPPENWADKVRDFAGQNRIIVMKKTKKSEKEIDIRPHIYEMEVRENTLYLKLAAGSAANIKPELVMEAFASFAGCSVSPFAYTIHRTEVYADKGEENKPEFVPLEALGEDIE